MIYIRKNSERGHFNFDWLKTYHSFSFGEYFDRAFMGFRSLRVINEDFVKAGAGFPTHGHRDMEIITFMISGALEHKDSMGNGSVIKPGEIQYMSAGLGVTHSEFNPLPDQDSHLLQIWIMPNELRAKPRYGQYNFEHRANDKLILLASPDGQENSIAIRQNAFLYRGYFKAGETLSLSLKNSASWIQMVSGKIELENNTIETGDGAAIEDFQQLNLLALENSLFLIFDLE